MIQRLHMVRLICLHSPSQWGVRGPIARVQIYSNILLIKCASPMMIIMVIMLLMMLSVCLACQALINTRTCIAKRLYLGKFIKFISIC